MRDRYWPHRGYRNHRKAEAVAEALRVETGSQAIIIASLDLASLRSVGACVAQFLSDNGPLHILVNDAGLRSRDLRRTDNGFEAHFGIQHLGHFALAKDLLPALRTADTARIVSLTPVAHRMSDVDLDDPNFLHRPYDHLPAYAASKTATSLFTVGCMQNCADGNVAANAVHPGGILSDVWADLDVLVLGPVMPRNDK
jgi:NAD(P)-dependent dehydrogenase (short-subunit alcohol dehydrogenase family)